MDGSGNGDLFSAARCFDWCLQQGAVGPLSTHSGAGSKFDALAMIITMKDIYLGYNLVHISALLMGQSIIP